MSFDPIGLYIREWRGNTEIFRESLRNNLPTLEKHPLFKDRLPKRWSLLVDGTWKLSSGYWSEELRAPDQSPAILISSATTTLPDRGFSLIVHELTHLVHHSLRPKEESWVREGIAMMSEYVATRNLNASVFHAFSRPETSLLSEFDPRDEGYGSGAERLSKYGHVLLYFYYLHRVCGGDALLDEIMSSRSEATGTQFLNEVLKRRFKPGESDAACSDFKVSFRSFQIARFKQDPATKSGFVMTSSAQATVRDRAQALLPYSAMAYRLIPDSEGKVGSCASGDIAWGTRRCIRIRFE